MKKYLLATLTLLLGTQISQAQISNANLLAHYRLDGNGRDTSGNEQHATEFNIEGAPDRFGKVSGASYFNGIDAYLTTPHSSTISPTDSISICLWVSQEQKSNTGWSPLIDKRYAPADDPYTSYFIGTHPNYSNKWLFMASSGTVGSLQTATAKNANPYNTWTFVAATYNRSQMKLYINGVLDTVVAKTGPLGYSALDLYIGYSGTGPNEYYKGKLDDLRIYGRILSPTEIMSLYSAPNAVAEQKLDKKDITLYPNPANDKLRIESSFSWKTVAVYDMLGKLVLSSDFDTELAISQINAGPYLLTLTNENGESVSKRFIKQ